MDYTIYCKDWTTINEGEDLNHWASDREQFGEMEKGDRVFVVSWRDARLWLFGHFTVDAIVKRPEAERRLHTKDLWSDDHHALAAKPLSQVVRRDITNLIPTITFISKKRPHIDPHGDPQQVRGFRQISESTAALLAKSELT